MIEITCVEDFRNFKKGDVIKIDSSRTLLVGNNGLGKSTLLQLLYCSNSVDAYEEHYVGERREYEEVKRNLYKFTIKTDYDYVFIYDPILDDPSRGQAAFDRHPRLSVEMLFSSGRKSHGEFSLLKYIRFTDNIVDRCNGIDPLNGKQDSPPLHGKKLLLIDEAENGLSLRNQFRVARSIHHVCRDGNLDVICSTHSTPFIENDGYTVFDIESRSNVHNLNYIEKIKQEIEELKCS